MGSDENASTAYTLPAQPPTIPTRPAKPRAASPDVEVVDAKEVASAGTKRPAPEDESAENEGSKKRKVDESNGALEGDQQQLKENGSEAKKAKKDVDEISDDGFEIL